MNILTLGWFSLKTEVDRGNSEIRVLYHTEMQREDGHPDFAYTQMRFMELDLEEKERNELIRQALDRMNQHFKQKKPKSFLKKKLKRLSTRNCRIICSICRASSI